MVLCLPEELNISPCLNIRHYDGYALTGVPVSSAFILVLLHYQYMFICSWAETDNVSVSLQSDGGQLKLLTVSQNCAVHTIMYVL